MNKHRYIPASGSGYVEHQRQRIESLPHVHRFLRMCDRMKSERYCPLSAEDMKSMRRLQRILAAGELPVFFADEFWDGLPQRLSSNYLSWSQHIEMSCLKIPYPFIWVEVATGESNLSDGFDAIAALVHEGPEQASEVVPAGMHAVALDGRGDPIDVKEILNSPGCLVMHIFGGGTFGPHPVAESCCSYALLTVDEEGAVSRLAVAPNCLSVAQMVTVHGCSEEQASAMYMATAMRMCAVVASMTSMLSCENVDTIRHATNSAVRPAVAIRERLPSTSYHVLRLDGRRMYDHERRKSLDDVPSRRYHAVRGHFRRLPRARACIDDATPGPFATPPVDVPTRRIWVRPYARGDRSLGTVTKSYDVHRPSNSSQDLPSA